MSRWPMVPLGEVVRHRKEFIQVDDLQTYKRCRVQLHAQGVVLRDNVIGAEIKTKKQQVCRAGDFLVAEIDAKVGGYGIVPDELDGAIVSSHYFLFAVDETKLDRSFLGYFIRTRGFFEQVAAQGSTNYAAVRPQAVLDYAVPLPSLAEQRRLVARIETLAAKTDEASRLRSQVRSEANRLMKAVLENLFDRASRAENWSRVPLREAATIARGKFAHRPRNEPRFYGGSVPFIQFGDISAARRYIRTFSQTLNEQGLRISQMFPRGTVAIAITGATVGATGILGFDTCFPDSIVGIQPLPGITSSEFIYWAVEREKHKALAQATQTTQPNINLQKLDSLTILLPSAAAQTKLVEQLSAIDGRAMQLEIHQTRSENDLELMLPAILNCAFQDELSAHTTVP